MPHLSYCLELFQIVLLCRQCNFITLPLHHTMNKMPHLLLASKSPRRQQILRDAGFDFDFVEIDVPEDFSSHLLPSEICEFLAIQKSEHYLLPIKTSILVTADTIVYVNGKVLNKPNDRNEAFAMLTELSGITHKVYTGVCLRNDTKKHVFHDCTAVTFYPLTADQIYHYIDTFDPYDKAGSYGVQDWMGYVGVKNIDGCFYNVMGFPMAKFYRELSAF